VRVHVHAFEHLKLRASVNSCLCTYISLYVCGCRCLQGKPWRDWGLEAAINIVVISLLSFGMCLDECVCVCVKARVWLCEVFTVSPSLPRRVWDVPASHQWVRTKAIYYQWDCVSASFFNSKPCILLSKNKWERFSIVELHLHHFWNTNDTIFHWASRGFKNNFQLWTSTHASRNLEKQVYKHWATELIKFWTVLIL